MAVATKKAPKAPKLSKAFILKTIEGRLKRRVTMLGKLTPKQITDKLVKLGITGAPTEHEDCPIHNYLKDIIPGGFRLEIDDMYVTVYTGTGIDNVFPVVKISTPPQIGKFIIMFDEADEVSRPRYMNKLLAEDYRNE